MLSPCTSVCSKVWAASLLSLKAFSLLVTGLAHGEQMLFIDLNLLISAPSCISTPTFLPGPFLKQDIFVLVLGIQADKSTNTNKKTNLHIILEIRRVLFFASVCCSSFIDEQLKQEKEEDLGSKVGVL